MNYDFLNAAQEVLSNPIADVVIGAAVVVGIWKGAKALMKSIKADNQLKAEREADLDELHRVVTPIQFPPPRP